MKIKYKLEKTNNKKTFQLQVRWKVMMERKKANGDTSVTRVMM